MQLKTKNCLHALRNTYKKWKKRLYKCWPSPLCMFTQRYGRTYTFTYIKCTLFLCKIFAWKRLLTKNPGKISFKLPCRDMFYTTVTVQVKIHHCMLENNTSKLRWNIFLFFFLRNRKNNKLKIVLPLQSLNENIFIKYSVDIV